MPFKNLTPEERASAEKLLIAIERKDRRYRVFNTAFLSVLLIGILIGVVLAYQSIMELKQQGILAKNIAEEQTKKEQKRQDTIIRRLDCVVLFFSKPDRMNLTIDDIDKCALGRDDDVSLYFENDSSISPSAIATIPQTTNGQKAPEQQTTSSPPPNGINQDQNDTSKDMQNETGLLKGVSEFLDGTIKGLRNVVGGLL